MTDKNILSLAKRIFSQPTSPFCEGFVLQEIKKIAEERKLPYYSDSAGNLILGIRSKKDLATRPRLLLFAHTDHPGFRITKAGDREVEALWMGGAPFDKMKGSRVAIFDPQTGERSARGHVVGFESGAYKRTGMKMKIRVSGPVSKGSFGAFDFPGFKLIQKNLITRAADDLAGCVMAVAAVLDPRSRKNTVAVLTRAEEVGFIGCMAFLRTHRTHKGSIAVSLEASRTLPGAELGKGPVLRLGDRTTLFDHSASAFLLKVAESEKILFQRRIMDGGSCEATALNAFGLRTTGLALPLANYHNQGRSGPAPEKINTQDLYHGARLLISAGRQFVKSASVQKDLLTTLDKTFHKLKKNLKIQVGQKEK